jgi:hypothetical protein
MLVMTERTMHDLNGNSEVSLSHAINGNFAHDDVMMRTGKPLPLSCAVEKGEYLGHRHQSENMGPAQPHLTNHASVRARQRGISCIVLACLVRYGRREHDHRGAEIVVHDRDSLEDVRRLESKDLWLAVERARELYAVVDSDGWVITVGHRYRRVIRDKSLSSLRPGRSRRDMGWRRPVH